LSLDARRRRHTPKHCSETCPVDETRSHSLPHSRRTLRLYSLADNVERVFKVLGNVVRFYELELEFAFDEFCGMRNHRAGDEKRRGTKV
jgi:hypothetical protein